MTHLGVISETIHLLQQSIEDSADKNEKQMTGRQ
jgi:hypothetical protein